MELTLEAYRNIVKYVGNRADLATLCSVSKGFRYVSERALYNTLYLHDVLNSISLLTTLAGRPRLSVLVDALTIYLTDDAHDNGTDDESNYESGNEGERGASSPSARVIPITSPDLLETYWSSVSSALQKTTRLRYLNIHINSNSSRATAWILRNCTFRLRRFHCDLDWDDNLVAFLNTQVDLDDLYIIDYSENSSVTPTNAETSPSQPPSHSLSLDTHSLPKLSTLECTFSEAAIAIVPGRPITRLKTCFSRSEITEKRKEMALLFSKIRLSTRPLRSLDIADSTYSEAFSIELLSSIVRTGDLTTRELRYLGTLVLPIMGKERLQFYGLLMRLPQLQCVEVEVSEWVPAPETPPAFRALASEMRLYSPKVARVVFVNDFERTAVAAVDGVCRMETDVNIDILWRDV